MSNALSALTKVPGDDVTPPTTKGTGHSADTTSYQSTRLGILLGRDRACSILCGASIGCSLHAFCRSWRSERPSSSSKDTPRRCTVYPAARDG